MREPGHNHPVRRGQEHDPVCGMEVDPSKAAESVAYQGQYFLLLQPWLRSKIPGSAGKLRAE